MTWSMRWRRRPARHVAEASPRRPAALGRVRQQRGGQQGGDAQERRVRRRKRRRRSGGAGRAARVSPRSRARLPFLPFRKRGSCSAAAAAAEEHSRYAFFISYFREEAGCTARVLQAALEENLGRRVFLDSTNADDIDEILTRGVARSDCLLLLQTKSVLTRPWCLLEIFTAVQHHIPIVPVAVGGAGYEFEAAKVFLQDLERQLNLINPGAVRAVRERLKARKATFSMLQRLLVAAVPPIISVQFQPDGGDNHLAAVVRDIAEKAPRAPARTPRHAVPPSPLLADALVAAASLCHRALGACVAALFVAVGHAAGGAHRHAARLFAPSRRSAGASPAALS